MKSSNSIRRDSRKTLHCVTNRIRQYVHLYTLWDALFLLSSVAFILFWILVHAQVDKISFTQNFLPFLRTLVIALSIGGLVYLAITYLPGYGRVPKIIADLLLITVFLGALLEPLNLMIDTVLSISESSEYFSMGTSGTSTDMLLVNSLIANRNFFGAGNPVAPYDDAMHLLNDLDAIFWFDHPLTILVYAYGSWIVLILFLIVAVWCICSIRIYMRIFSRWFEWVFIFCFLTVAYQMFPALLVAIEILPPSIYTGEAFYYSSIDIMLSFFTLPLAAMLAIIKRNNDSL